MKSYTVSSLNDFYALTISISGRVNITSASYDHNGRFGYHYGRTGFIGYDHRHIKPPFNDNQMIIEHSGDVPDFVIKVHIKEEYVRKRELQLSNYRRYGGHALPILLNLKAVSAQRTTTGSPLRYYYQSSDDIKSKQIFLTEPGVITQTSRINDDHEPISFDEVLAKEGRQIFQYDSYMFSSPPGIDHLEVLLSGENASDTYICFKHVRSADFRLHEEHEMGQSSRSLDPNKELLMNLRECPPGWVDFIESHIVNFDDAIVVPEDIASILLGRDTSDEVVKMPPLHYVIRVGAYETIEMLVDLGASINHRWEGDNSVDVAVLCGEETYALKLHKAGGEVTSKTLKSAIEHDRSEFLEGIFDEDITRVQEVFEDCSLVCWAARLGKTKIAVDLLGRGADKNARYRRRNLAQLASNGGFRETASELRTRINTVSPLSSF